MLLAHFGIAKMSAFKQAMGLPVQQVNANLDEGLVMRVGITGKSGGLPFHAFQSD